MIELNADDGHILAQQFSQLNTEKQPAVIN
jgi:hypothetical protein